MGCANINGSAMIYRLLVFLLINFGALAVGGFFTGKGVPSDWYTDLAKAPCTPPGWVFGFAWTTIMVCFSIYLAYLWPVVKHKNTLIALFVVQWVLNVSWNPAFFYYHHVLAGLFIITGLTLIVGVFLLLYWPDLKSKSLLLLPYFVWLLVATSLNGYIFLKN
jgi:benzodiazapine receptor